MSGEDEQLFDGNINTVFKNENLHTFKLKKAIDQLLYIYQMDLKY